MSDACLRSSHRVGAVCSCDHGRATDPPATRGVMRRVYGVIIAGLIAVLVVLCAPAFVVLWLALLIGGGKNL